MEVIIIMANDKYTSALTQEELEIITEYIEERSKGCCESVITPTA